MSICDDFLSEERTASVISATELQRLTSGIEMPPAGTHALSSTDETSVEVELRSTKCERSCGGMGER